MKSPGSSLCFSYDSNYPIWSQICTCHDSSAVMTRAKFQTNLVIIFQTRANECLQDLDNELINTLWNRFRGPLHSYFWGTIQLSQKYYFWHKVKCIVVSIIATKFCTHQDYWTVVAYKYWLIKVIKFTMSTAEFPKKTDLHRAALKTELPKLSPLIALQLVIKTIWDATSDNKVDH